MKLLTNYIQQFLSRAGSYVLVATIISRLLSFFASWIALQFIDNKELGVILFAWNIITFLIPFIGFGLPQSLIRYGALLTNTNDKKIVSNYVVKNGTFVSFFLSLLVTAFSLLFSFEFEKTDIYLTVFSLSFIPLFWFEVIKIKLRLEHNNKTFSLVEVVYNLILVLLVLMLSYLYKELGYVWAIVLTPTLTSFVFFNRLQFNLKQTKKLKIINREFWKYGFFGGLSNVATLLLFSIDILLIGNLLKNSEAVTAFKYVSLIPFSILFLPRVFIATDFVSFTENINNKKYIFDYIKSYVLLFTLISICYFSFFYFFADETLLLFDKGFTKYKLSFLILNFGVCGILILRGLFGNLLSSIGLVKINYYITLVALVINYTSNQLLIPKYGIKGAAITSATLMWFTGVMSAFTFFYFYKRIRTTS
ncbi:O-antigen/teichoic acid export membrane protein [Tenacibaculum adriaticum]|uniref:O-antigen/teichoic acid export membrane protein n=1 Tax=Tenacibaculum adriaticum TaxID=413713 RepID=A0A5S5DQR0_9FLAO|nr:oligosaccharide flippase family protein [Tenacibaculum adriaticum]TYP98014.1 O-antigen/teichoic acid export membrane protein [Tenacibaculum adriaticum]